MDSKDKIMSNISNRHNINLFVSGKSEALSGQRLAKVGYKSTTKTPAKFKSVCASVPYISELDIRGKIDSLIPYVKELLEQTQDKVLRNLYESAGGVLASVSDEDIGITACINYLEAESTGGRMTKEFLESWFSTNVEDNLTLVIAEKLKFDLSTDEQVAVVGKHVNGYKALVSSLAGNKVFLQPVQIAGIRKALEIASVEDDVSEKLGKKLDIMEKKEKIEDLLEL